MITLTRRAARCLRGVLRRSALGVARTGPIAPLVLEAEGGKLSGRYRYGGIAVEHTSPRPHADSGVVALPLEALADFEGRDETPVAIEATGPRTARARWADRGVPASREYDVPEVGRSPTSPGRPTPGTRRRRRCSTPWPRPRPRPARSPRATASTASSSAAAGVRSAPPTAASSSFWAGSPSPGPATCSWAAAPRSRGRNCPATTASTSAWPGNSSPSAPAPGRSGSRPGPASASLTSTAPCRPRGPPRHGSASTRRSRGSWPTPRIARPGPTTGDAPVTLDLDGRVAVRARGESGPATELVLARSSCTGQAARVAMNREYLARAARLGFVEVEVDGPDAPLCCRDGRRSYAWQPLGEAAVVGPADDAVRVESTAAGPRAPARVVVARTVARPAVIRAPAPEGRSPRPAAPNGMAALIEDAVALHAALGEARSRSARLVAALRAERRRSRLLASTIAQLRQIRLQDVAGYYHARTRSGRGLRHPSR